MFEYTASHKETGPLGKSTRWGSLPARMRLELGIILRETRLELDVNESKGTLDISGSGRWSGRKRWLGTTCFQCSGRTATDGLPGTMSGRSGGSYFKNSGRRSRKTTVP